MDDAALWVSLPMPAVLLDDNDLITDLNPAAEGFLNISSRAVTGTPVWDKLAVGCADRSQSQACAGAGVTAVCQRC